MYRIAFDLELRHENWPPVSVERMWGEKTKGKFEIRVANIPFFVRGISYGDLIRVRPDHDRREFVFESWISESGHSTIRIIFMAESERASVEEKLRSAGCDLTSMSSFSSLIAVDIPPSVDYASTREWLVKKVQSEIIEIEESAISSIHRRRLRKFP